MFLWTSSENQKTDRNLQDIDTKIELIRMLQPEFVSVHIFQIWNKAYNLSVQMSNLASKYATKSNGVSFTAAAGRVTGFLGPNGAGKSTTMRAILGLDRPTSGEALVNGLRYAGIRRPMHEVGALLDAGAVHGGRSAYDHLRVLARSNGIKDSRVVTTLEAIRTKNTSELPGGFAQAAYSASVTTTDTADNSTTATATQTFTVLDSEDLRLEQRGSIAGKTVAWIGDANNMLYSWLQAAQVFGFHVNVRSFISHWFC